jgi:hypothetical protein
LPTKDEYSCKRRRLAAAMEERGLRLSNDPHDRGKGSGGIAGGGGRS